MSGCDCVLAWNAFGEDEVQLSDVLRPRFARRVGALVFVSAPLAGVSVAKADLTGLDVSVAGYCCTAVEPADLITNVATGTVPVNFPLGTFFQTGRFDLILVPAVADIDSEQITVELFSSGVFEGGSFNGTHFAFSGPSVPEITNVTVDSASTFDPLMSVLPPIRST
jgi:hypothetical protein